MATITKKEKVLSLRELVDGIGAALKEINGEVSDLRKHAVDSHIRTALRGLGYRPREEKGKPASIVELNGQLSAALTAEKDAAAEEAHDHIHAHLRTTLSNLGAETALTAAPELKVAPAPEGGKGKATLAIIALLFLALFATAPQARAGVDSFNITNTLYGAVNITGYPTNSTTLFTNSVSTNQVGQSTGGPINVQNYEFVGFTFKGFFTSTNAGTLTFSFVGANPANSGPTVLVNTNGVITQQDWETTSPFSVWIPIPIGTNVAVTFTTNLDVTLIRPRLFLGIYNITNSTGPACVGTNCWAGLSKKIIPHSFSGGNF
jgi:hypothetical protein